MITSVGEPVEETLEDIVTNTRKLVVHVEYDGESLILSLIYSLVLRRIMEIQTLILSHGHNQ